MIPCTVDDHDFKLDFAHLPDESINLRTWLVALLSPYPSSCSPKLAEIGFHPLVLLYTKRTM